MPSSLTTWPTGDDLADWIDSPVSSTSTARFDSIVAAATDVVRGHCDPDKLPDNVAQCPESVRTAILIEAARIHTRTQNATGVISFGEFAVRVNRFDPDVERLLINYRVSPSP